MKRLIATLFFCLALTANAHSLTLAPLQGSGSFLQKNSLNNPIAWSNTFRWFVVDAALMSNSMVQGIDRPLVMAYSGQSVRELKVFVSRYWTRLAAVVWEYGPKNTRGLLSIKERRAKAEADLSQARRLANEKGIPFGVITVAGPDGSGKKNGVYFNRLSRFADFVMPCLYCQWWKHNPDQTRQTYAKEVRTATVPVIPLVSFWASSDKLIRHEISSEGLIENYYGLSPAPRAMGYYNLAYLDEDLMTSVISIDETLEQSE